MPNEHPKNHKFLIRVLIWVVVILGIGIAGYFGSKQVELFKAELIGGGDQDVAADLYIPQDYEAESPTIGTIAVKAAQLIDEFYGLVLTLDFNPLEIDLKQTIIIPQNSPLENRSHTTVKTSDKLSIIFAESANPISIADNAVLFEIDVDIESRLSEGTKIDIGHVSPSRINEGIGDRDLIFSSGLITITEAAVECPLDCGDYGDCDPQTGLCDCYTGYTGPACGECDTGYIGYPNCTLDPFAELAGLVLSLSQDTVNQLSDVEREQAYHSAYVMVNSSDSAGRTITLEGQTVLIEVDPLLDCNVDELACINDITDKLSVSLAVEDAGTVLVNVTKYPDVPGLLKLEATAGNADGSLDGITTTSGEVTIVPGMDYTITLYPTDTYRLRIIGKFNDGSVQELNFNDVTWMPQPVNRLNNEALNGGLLERGDVSGTTPLYVEIEKADGTVIQSNQITVDVPSGPIIEYVRQIDRGSIVRGSTVLLSVKVSDVDQISDIQDMRTSLVLSDYNTYSQITQDPDAIWFTITPFVEEIEVTDSGVEEAEEELEIEVQNYRIYSIPVEIPERADLFDGEYKLALEITDTEGNLATAVIPIYIGEIASGDVNADGQLSMMDVILVFQIVNGRYSPTQVQRDAADINGDGSITMLDVILLFNQVSQ